MFKKVPSKVDFPALEEGILQFWQRERVFEQTQARREGSPRYVFYEGPPTANGVPHIGHAMARSMKDLIPRYKTMDGYLVRRKAGWDTHGLPVELEVEKELGIKGKPDIEAFGVAAFVAACRVSVFKYEQEWQKLTERLGFWLDMDNPYVTYRNEYIESVWWSLRQAWDKGLLYQGFKVLPYCPRCGTSLSSHEVAQGYEEVEDPSVFVRFPLAETAGRSFLVWTTTPWTLPANVVLVVGANIEYALVRHHNEELILAKDCLHVLQGEFEVLKTFPGADLVGMKYRPPYDLPSLSGHQVHYVVSGDFVTTTDGTGIVHAAPAFGEDDSRIAALHSLPTANPVDGAGRFTGDVSHWQGLFVKDADPKIIDFLREKGLLYSVGLYRHNYPFCWRCDTPLLYYARSSWFIRMTALKEQMLSNNSTINWFPEHLRAGRFGNFLENIVDWAISRERYWGTPLPIWRCECGHEHCVGSLAELRTVALSLPDEIDLHRPYIDDIRLACAKCGGEMQRISEVLDCWYDSGSMPFAQWHYPFDNRELFDESFPADYICEGIDQTRGWFYTLLAISTFTFGCAPYRNVVSTEMGLDEHGKKMSKSRGNRFDPWEAFNVVGADGLRWFIYTVNPPWYPKRFSMEAMQEHQRRVLGTLWNVYSFFVLYANIDGFAPKDADVPVSRRPLIDRWLLAKLNMTITQVRAGLDVFNSMTATRAIDDFVDELSNWYVRRNRRRFWKGAMDADKTAAYLTLYETLVTLARLLAPFTPFISEELYGNLVLSADNEAPISVHMNSYPVADDGLLDSALVAEMALARDIVSLGRAVRNKANAKVRQPVSELYFVKPGRVELRPEIVALVQDELNVKVVTAAGDTTRFVTYSVKPNFRLLGPRFGKEVQSLAKALAEVNQACLADAVTQNKPLAVSLKGTLVVLELADLDVRAQEREGFQAESSAGLTVIMDLTLTPDLIEEGLVRELVSKLQAMRKEAGFEVEDKIVMSLSGDAAVTSAVAKWGQYVQDEVLATHILAEPLGDAFARTLEINGYTVVAAVKR